VSINATFWSWASMQQFIIAIPYTTNGAATGPYIWPGGGQFNQFSRPAGAPGCRVGAIVGQFLMMGDFFDGVLQPLFVGDGYTTTYSGTLTTPMSSAGLVINDQEGIFSVPFTGGMISGDPTISLGTINFQTGALALTFNTPPILGDQVYAQYNQSAPYRMAWSAIGNPLNWPTPLTEAAFTAQSGINDLQVDLGPVMFIAGFPLYGLVFQRWGITRASYIGSDVVFSWQPYEFKRGLIAHGAAIQVSSFVYFLSDDGFFVTDGANVVPFGTASDNSTGIDKWFWSNVNSSALESIRAGYDAHKRCVFFAIPTGSNVLPDTLLIYNILAQKWTRAAVSCESIWTADDGSLGVPGDHQVLGMMDQSHVTNFLTGPTLTGYMESTDLFFGDRKFITGSRPHVNSTDLPLVIVGSRNSLQDPVTYTSGTFPDQFSRIAPSISSGIYQRVRVQSGSATALHGATLLTQSQGRI